MEEKEQLGARIARLRGDKTQIEFAAEAGIDASTLNRIEKGKHHNPSRATLNAIARVLGVSVSSLLDDDAGRRAPLPSPEPDRETLSDELAALQDEVQEARELLRAYRKRVDAARLIADEARLAADEARLIADDARLAIAEVRASADGARTIADEALRLARRRSA